MLTLALLHEWKCLLLMQRLVRIQPIIPIPNKYVYEMDFAFNLDTNKPSWSGKLTLSKEHGSYQEK